MKRRQFAVGLLAAGLFFPPGSYAANWQLMSGTLNVPRECAGGAADGKLYSIGGGNASHPYGTNIVEVYYPATDTWSDANAAEMPTSRHSIGCAVVRSYIYAVGGHVINSRTENERYDAGANSWTSKAPLPVGRSGPGVTSYNGAVYAFGGNSYGTYSDRIDVYDPNTDSWTNVGSMPSAGEPWAAVTLGNKIYLAGGGFGGVATAHLWSYDPTTGVWDTSTLPSMVAGRSAHALVAAGGRIYAIGGSNASGYLASVESWAPGDAAWQIEPSLNVGRGYFGAGVIGDDIYVFGGYSDGAGNIGSTEKLSLNLPRLLVYYRNHAIYVAKADGTGERQLTSGSAYDFLPSVSRDGSLIAFVRDDCLWLMNADGSDQHKIVDKSAVGDNLVHESDWTSDDSWIYFTAVSGASSGGMWKVHPDGTGLTSVRSGYIAGLRIRPVSWDRLIFNQRRNSLSYSPNARITDLSGGNEEQVTDGPISEDNAVTGTSWSPNGEHFAFTYGHVYLQVGDYPATPNDPSPGNPYNLWNVKTFSSGNSHQPTWLDDQTLIWVDEPNDYRLHTINIYTGEERDLGINGNYPYVGARNPAFWPELTVTVSAHPEWGTITIDPCSAYYSHNQVVTLTAQAVNPDARVWNGWSGDVDPNHKYDNPLTITMDSDKEITTGWHRCGVGVGGMLPLTAIGLLGFFLLRRRS